MAAQNASTTGADTQNGLRQRTVAGGQANGSYIPKELGDKMDEKTKRKVNIMIRGLRCASAYRAAMHVEIC